MLVRADGYREDNFIVALTNTQPIFVLPYNYTLCGQWPGAAPDGATMFVGCPSDLPPYRYAAILANTTIMNICEVEVYGIRGIF